MEFTERFGLTWGMGANVMKKLLPEGKASSWGMLDQNINHFCKQFYESWQEHQDKIDFFDNARFILKTLPMRQDYKLPENKQEYPTPEEAAANFATCSLCWRSVYRRPLEKKTPLCHLHDMPSNLPEYRKRTRMKKQAESIRLSLLKSLPPLTLVKEQGAELNDYLQSLCLNLSGPLLNLAKYLHSLSMPLSSGQDILRASEHPIYFNRISPLEVQAWEYHFEDNGKHFKLNYIKLLTAEAWLRVGAERKHGGKRR